MADEFDHLSCPMCGSVLVYSEGTHDLGCRNNPKPFGAPNKKREKGLHEEPATYVSDDKNQQIGANKFKSDKLCDNKKHNSDSKVVNMCELYDQAETSQSENAEAERSNMCVFGLSFTESATNGTLWSIRIVDGETNYAALMRLVQDIEKRVRNNEPLAANVPNLPKKVERSNVSKLAFRYNLEIEDLYSIKYSTETIERLAMFYNLTQKEIRHIKQTDVMEE